jgi:hypothetical protein
MTIEGSQVNGSSCFYECFVGNPEKGTDRFHISSFSAIHSFSIQLDQIAICVKSSCSRCLFQSDLCWSAGVHRETTTANPFKVPHLRIVAATT